MFQKTLLLREIPALTPIVPITALVTGDKLMEYLFLQSEPQSIPHLGIVPARWSLRWL